jgi:hypothetical protein
MVGPRVTLSGVATFGRNVNFPVLLDEDRYEFKQDLSIDRGRHFSSPGPMSRVNAYSSFPISFAGSFTFRQPRDVHDRPADDVHAEVRKPAMEP